MIARDYIKKLNITLSIALMGCCLFMASCDLFCSGGDEYDFVGANRFGFNIVDRLTKEDILKIGQHTYNYDTLVVYSESWEVAYPEHNKEWDAWDGRVYLTFINRESDRNVFNQRISRRFFFYFNYQDVDTIDIQFEMRRGECDQQVMRYFRVDYNNAVYFDGKTEFVPNVEFLK